MIELHEATGGEAAEVRWDQMMGLAGALGDKAA